MGITVGALSSDCELDHIEVGAAGFAGIMAKTDPNCDSTTWRGNFTMYNVKIHDNYIHDTGGEGLYVGNSFYGGGMTVSCNGENKVVFPHNIYGLEIYNNRLERTGCEGIQYSCAPDAQVHDNFVQTSGQSPFANYQDNGVQIGGGAGGDFYNNVIINSPGMGLIVVGHYGNNRIFNNVINGAGADGLFCDDRPGTVAGTFVQISNNTINNTNRDAIRLYDEVNVNTVVNNVMTNYGRNQVGRPITLMQGATVTQAGNYTPVSASAAGYTDIPNNDFRPTATSPLVRAGVDASPWGVTFDLFNRPRPVGSRYTIGAYEYVAPGGGRLGAIGTAFDVFGTEITAPRAYPVPCRDRVTFQLPASQAIRRVEVYSSAGRLVKQYSAKEPQQHVSMPTENWPNGVYVYLVYDDEEQKFEGRLVKE